VATLKNLVGSGDRIALFTGPFIVVGIGLAVVDPAIVRLTTPAWFHVLSLAVLIVGLAIWAWSVLLILANVPQHRLITGGPYAWVKHPLYTSVALLVLPWLGFLVDTWLGLAFGAVLYLGSRLFSPREEAALAETFGVEWREYRRNVKFGWV
jgi:protein-S-isoprenylcysteine O-methyltransferase Ste14